MQNPKTLICASYLSVLFAPVIVPLLIFLTTNSEDVKNHSKKAMISHLIPIALSIILILFSFIVYFTTGLEKLTLFLIISMLLITIYSVLYFGLIIWNIIQAIRVFKAY